MVVTCSSSLKLSLLSLCSVLRILLQLLLLLIDVTLGALRLCCSRGLGGDLLLQLIGTIDHSHPITVVGFGGKQVLLFSLSTLSGCLLGRAFGRASK